MSDEPWNTDPQWMQDCVDHYLCTEKRGPTTAEILAWREADVRLSAMTCRDAAHEKTFKKVWVSG